MVPGEKTKAAAPCPVAVVSSWVNVHFPGETVLGRESSSPTESILARLWALTAAVWSSSKRKGLPPCVCRSSTSPLSTRTDALPSSPGPDPEIRAVIDEFGVGGLDREPASGLRHVCHEGPGVEPAQFVVDELQIGGAFQGEFCAAAEHEFGDAFDEAHPAGSDFRSGFGGLAAVFPAGAFGFCENGDVSRGVGTQPEGGSRGEQQSRSGFEPGRVSPPGGRRQSRGKGLANGFEGYLAELAAAQAQRGVFLNVFHVQAPQGCGGEHQALEPGVLLGAQFPVKKGVAER